MADVRPTVGPTPLGRRTRGPCWPWGPRIPAAGISSLRCLTDPVARELWVLRAKVAELGFPLVIGASISGLLDSHQRAVQSAERRLQGGRADHQMAVVLAEQEGEPFFLASLALEPGTKFSLAKAAKLAPGAVPALILSISGVEVKAKAVVPAGLVSQQFSAEQWLAGAAQELGSEMKPPRARTARCTATC